MASAYFDPAVGGDGTTVDDTAGPNGLKKNGHRLRFVPALSNIVNIALNALASATAAAASASSALNAPGTAATCINTIAIPTVFPTDVAFTLQQTGKLFTKGQTLVFADNADPEKQFVGVLMSFNSGTGVGSLRVRQSNGTGSLSNWNVSLSTPIDGTLTGRVSDLEAANASLADSLLFFFGEL